MGKNKVEVGMSTNQMMESLNNMAKDLAKANDELARSKAPSVLASIKLILRKWSCHHRWYVHKEVHTFRNEEEAKSKLVRGVKHVVICERCGKVKLLNIL